ncbi:MAG: ferritin-like domain-containing protein [Candidatus Binatia bacterium]
MTNRVCSQKRRQHGPKEDRSIAQRGPAIDELRQKIKVCAEEGDPTSRLLLEEILSDEEEHADRWETILGRGPKG